MCSGRSEIVYEAYPNDCNLCPTDAIADTSGVDCYCNEYYFAVFSLLDLLEVLYNAIPIISNSVFYLLRLQLGIRVFCYY